MKLSTTVLLITSVGSLLTMVASHVEEDSHPHRSLRVGVDQRMLGKKNKKGGSKKKDNSGKKKDNGGKNKAEGKKKKGKRVAFNPESLGNRVSQKTSIYDTPDIESRRNQGNPNRNGLSKCTGNEVPKPEKGIPDPKNPPETAIGAGDVCQSSCQCFRYDAQGTPVSGSGCCCTAWSIISSYKPPSEAVFPSNGERGGVCIDFLQGPKSSGEVTVSSAILSCCKPLTTGGGPGEAIPGGVGLGGAVDLTP